MPDFDPSDDDLYFEDGIFIPFEHQRIVIERVKMAEEDSSRMLSLEEVSKLISFR